MPSVQRMRPRRNYYYGGGSTHRAHSGKSGGGAVLCQNFWRDHFDHSQNAERHNYRVVEIPQHWNEVWNQIYWRQSVSSNA
ncbi:hypothetical protein DFR49_4072 [Hephaestia caeni]|uniref:Uncharacterized protein n=1 Tax=Hephaestia caeni TaxID=645617 RepID=A0A397NMF2_9SPHN|nr:hypothetical protein DFR49_4072 [Hephaestia caeni]